jgi:hypothetical protein
VTEGVTYSVEGRGTENHLNDYASLCTFSVCPRLRPRIAWVNISMMTARKTHLQRRRRLCLRKGYSSQPLCCTDFVIQAECPACIRERHLMHLAEIGDAIAAAVALPAPVTP